MSHDNACSKDEKASLHHARRKFLKQSSALTALAIAPASLIIAAGNALPWRNNRGSYK